MPVEGVDGNVDPAGDDLGLEHPLGGPFRAVDDPPVEDQFDGVGAAHVEVVGNKGLEEAAGMAGGVEHDRAGGFDLAHGELPPVAGHLIRAGQRRG